MIAMEIDTHTHNLCISPDRSGPDKSNIYIYNIKLPYLFYIYNKQSFLTLIFCLLVLRAKHSEIKISVREKNSHDKC